MTLEEAFEIRSKINAMLKSKDKTERSTAMVMDSVLRGEYLRIEDAKEDIKFLSETN
ncbi:hypothetical protein CL89_gp044 [Aeromonas phage PX29]|uniref:Uncharacterized protein n=1 Tax=Aeromonas phage PX29 TaxID=926067 RepID=E5DPX7_9CAUD|nr:hypothetical protein CL89_gp044 [Aeromonas phage PX29]ADQ52763.1 hypothetical protein PX29p044 [Aeromonas phage PX29]QAX98623.1 hypothetical protein ASfcp2_290 [Aeromonas phage AsFcp_2]